MIWLTWRQHRRQLLFAIAGLAIVAALIVPTGQTMHEAYVDTGLAACVRDADRTALVEPNPGGRNCETLANNFTTRFASMVPLAVLFVFLPLFVGVFWGAPLVAREVEHGTHRLVWTQGVSRLRWALVKFGFVGATSLALAAVYAMLLSWWLGPLNATLSRLEFLIFDLQGVVPLAYTVFAVALGVLVGTVTRKVLPAMAATLVGYVAVRVAVDVLARPRFMAPEERRFPVAGGSMPNQLRGDWILSSGVYNASGREIAAGATALCSPRRGDNVASSPPPETCDVASGYGAGAYNMDVYHPADRFWPFQYIESAIFATLAVILFALAVYRVRRRIS
jgi:hypothetical protein